MIGAGKKSDDSRYTSINFKESWWREAQNYPKVKAADFFAGLFGAIFDGMPEPKDSTTPLYLGWYRGHKYAAKRRTPNTLSNTLSNNTSNTTSLSRGNLEIENTIKDSETGEGDTRPRVIAKLVEMLPIMQRRFGATDEFNTYFRAEMDKIGWVRETREGRVIDVTAMNLALAYRGWWDNFEGNPRNSDKKNFAARVGGLDDIPDVR